MKNDASKIKGQSQYKEPLIRWIKKKKKQTEQHKGEQLGLCVGIKHSQKR